MFLGHFAAGMAAKRLSPTTPLPLLFIAAQFVDLLWPAFLLIGLEQVAIVPGMTAATPLDFISYPFTHSLLGTLGWGFLLGGVVYAFRKNEREAWIVAACVISHWFLDFFSHRPDLLLAPGMDIKYGLGLWNSPPATIVVEFGMFAAGIAIYTRITKAEDKKGSIGFWVLISVLAVIYIGNLFGPPPPSVNVLAYSAIGLWLFVAWSWWVEAHRKS